METETEYKLLEAFVVDNPELEELESELQKFNVFEALGAVRQELRHSDFLAFLFDPNQNHNLGDAFLKRFLKRALSAPGISDIPFSPIDLDACDLHDTAVYREWHNIDILIVAEEAELAIILENKIDSGESPGQLGRYYETVTKHFPRFKLICFYLTPDGGIPTNDDYIPISYGLVASVTESIVTAKESALGPDILAVLKQYVQMLRRYIVGESEIARLCQTIYKKHRKALDLIFEHKPDLQADIRAHLEDKIAQTPDLIKDYCSKAYVRFLPAEWDIPILSEGSGWVNSNRLLLFECENTSSLVVLRLYIGPGNQATREKLYSVAQTNAGLFKAKGNLSAKWKSLYSQKFLTEKDIRENSLEAVKDKIDKRWHTFVTVDLPRIQSAFSNEDWMSA